MHFMQEDPEKESLLSIALWDEMDSTSQDR